MKNEKLIKALNDCAAHCNYCADACLDEDNIQMMVDCIRTDRACAEICSATAKLLAANYSDVKEKVEYCHRICKKCADECAKHDAQHCKDCAEACKKCAEACEAFLA
ncbi:four-helix bundle copper-binding protein [Zunongwangia sp. F363]|uniref:Four-helix bundle copper-binding protein n=1 Tax=Autumnicola tepida TaxID=3075595 RepID=A0ABU3C6H2_9FLAO|nr:four-helix bundle copper-binding protein [Zunongwangia sp. F363]MDT0641945.1 four-helix bundle copper-binding protein [Zunongwangia sp. F363]